MTRFTHGSAAKTRAPTTPITFERRKPSPVKVTMMPSPYMNARPVVLAFDPEDCFTKKVSVIGISG